MGQIPNEAFVGFHTTKERRDKIDAAMEHYGVPLKTIMNWILEGQLPLMVKHMEQQKREAAPTKEKPPA